jgi:HSP20 family protein
VDLENEINTLLGTTLADTGLGAQFPVVLDEDKANIYVRADLPGVSRQDINLEFAEGRLTISAERKQKIGEKEESTSLSRSFSVPSDIQADKAGATYENGVLTVTLPKREEAKPLKIAIS